MFSFTSAKPPQKHFSIFFFCLTRYKSEFKLELKVLDTSRKWHGRESWTVFRSVVSDSLDRICIRILPLPLGQKTKGRESTDNRSFRSDQERCRYLHPEGIQDTLSLCIDCCPDPVCSDAKTDMARRCREKYSDGTFIHCRDGSFCNRRENRNTRGDVVERSYCRERGKGNKWDYWW